MSKVAEELDFLWRERVRDYYRSLAESALHETKGETYYSDRMKAIQTVLTLQGLTVKGIEG